MKRVLLALAASVVLTGAAAPAVAQERYVRLDGWIQWIAADKMMLVLDGGPGVPIDLTRVPQDEYRTLAQRDRVAVIGVVSADNRRVFATSVISARGSGYQSP